MIAENTKYELLEVTSVSLPHELRTNVLSVVLYMSMHARATNLLSGIPVPMLQLKQIWFVHPDGGCMD